MPDTQYVDPYEARINAQAQLVQQPLQARYDADEIARRTAENKRMQMLGILGQLSGDEAAGNVGSAVYKSAQADRQPRVTDRGVYDPLSGQYTLNPEVLQEQRRAELGRLEDRSAAARQSWTEARQREQERAAAADVQRQFLASQNAATRAVAGAGRAAAQDARNWTVEDRMSDDFARDTKPQQLILNAHKNLAAIAQKTDAASDVALIYSYMKILDPTSVVREGEFSTAQNAAGIPDRVRNMYNSALSGQRLNPQQRSDMLDTAGRLGAEAQSQIDSTAEQYAAKAQRRQLNPENITGRFLPNAVAAQQQRGPGRAPSRAGAVKFSDLPQ